MTAAPTVRCAHEVRAMIAERWLSTEGAPDRIGSVTLHAHQREAVARVRRLLREHGGALLADDVGLGKTFVAAALIREFARPLVVLPAAVRAKWCEELARAGTNAEIVTYTALSRGTVPAGDYDFVVLDEAHHARTPGRARYARLAHLCRNSRVLLITASPIHNRRADLAALFGLFLGASAHAESDAEHARLIVRRTHADVESSVCLPRLGEPRWLDPLSDSDLLPEIMALPPPIPPHDGETGGALVQWTLVRQWASSNAALVAGLRRRLVRAAAIESALEGGCLPTKRDLASWAAGEDAVQLVFLELGVPRTGESHQLLQAVREHASALRALLVSASAHVIADRERAARLRAVRRAHPGEQIVAFSQFADTVCALYSAMRADGGVGALTSRGGAVAGGRLTRTEMLQRFAPRAMRTAPPRAIERVDLLLTTDVLSEGLDLHDASVVVHLDLPWTPARIAQRVGRSRRIGAVHAHTAVYAMPPPTSAEHLLGVERRLQAKLSAAARAVGASGAILPPLRWPGNAAQHASSGAAEVQERVISALAAWRGERATSSGADHSAPSIAVVRGERPALLALARLGTTAVLGASVDGAAITGALSTVLDAAAQLTGSDAEHAPSAIAAALAAAEWWVASLAASDAAGGGRVFRSGARRAALKRILSITAHTARHRQPVLAPLLARARVVTRAPFGAGAERVLGALATAPLPDEAWLLALTAFGDAHAPATTGGRAHPVLEALLVSDQAFRQV